MNEFARVPTTHHTTPKSQRPSCLTKTYFFTVALFRKDSRVWGFFYVRCSIFSSSRQNMMYYLDAVIIWNKAGVGCFRSIPVQAPSPSPSPAAAYLPSCAHKWMHRYRCRPACRASGRATESQSITRAGFPRSAGNVPNDDAALKRRDERARRANVLAHILPNTWALPSYSSCHQKSFTQISPAKQHCKASESSVCTKSSSSYTIGIASLHRFPHHSPVYWIV